MHYRKHVWQWLVQWVKQEWFCTCTWLCGLEEGSSYPSVLSIAALTFLSARRCSHWMWRGLQWGVETTHLFQAWKEHVSRRNLILQSARPGVDIISYFLNVQHSKLARATLAFFSSDAQLCSCHKCFSHYLSASQSSSACTYLWVVCSIKCKSPYISPSDSFDVWSAPTMQDNCTDRYSTVVCSIIVMDIFLRSWGEPYVVLLIIIHEVWVW